MSAKLEIFYKCRCMPAEATLPLRERMVGEAVLNYMRVATAMISQDHQRRSPHCRAKEMEYAKIPAPEAGVGFPNEKPE